MTTESHIRSAPDRAASARSGTGSNAMRRGRTDWLEAWLARAEAWAAADVDARPLGWLRVATGSALAYEGATFMARGWARALFTGPQFHFSYGLWAVPVPSELGLDLLFLIQLTAGILLATGVFTRWAAGAGALAFGYVFLLDQALYLNHFYLLWLLLAAFVVLPAGSVVKGQTVPRGALTWSRFHVALPYVFGGLAKLQPDWLSGRPLGDWLARGPFTAMIDANAASFIAVGTALFDLAVVPALLYRPTRWVAYGAACLFHVANASLFHIGVFPWLMIGATLVFLDGEDASLAQPTENLSSDSSSPRGFGTELAPDAATSVEHPRATSGGAMCGVARPDRATRWRRWALVAGCLWMGLHVALPLRGHFTGRNISWTGEGHEFAWRMKLHDLDSTIELKRCDLGTSSCEVIDLEERLTDLQIRRMGDRPEMLTELARALRVEAERAGRQVVVHADVWSSLNGRPWQRRVDALVDLSRADDDELHWVLPLDSRQPQLAHQSRR